MDLSVGGDGFDNLAFSPDSHYLAAGIGSINIWKVADGTLLTTLIPPQVTPGVRPYAYIQSIRFSPDGKMLVMAYRIDMKHTVIAYRTEDWQIAWTYEPQKIVETPRKGITPRITTPLAFTTDSKNVILGTGECGSENVNFKQMSRILILDAQSGKLLRSIDDIHVMNPTALAISPDGKMVATGTMTGGMDQTYNEKTHQVVTVDNKDPVRIWSLETGKMVRELPVHTEVNYLVFSPDGKYLFGALRDYHTSLTLAVWAVASGNMVQEVKHSKVPIIMALSPDGKKLAAACQSKLSIFEITAGN